MTQEQPIRPSQWVELGIGRALQKWVLNQPYSITPTGLVYTTARGENAVHLWSNGWNVALFEPDHFRFRMLKDSLLLGDALLSQRCAARARVESQQVSESQLASQFSLICQSDPEVPHPVDLAVLALRRDGVAEFARDLIQAFARLVKKPGWLIVGTDHPNDHWVGEQLRKIVRPSKGMKRVQFGDEVGERGATIYMIPSERLNIRYRNFHCESAFRDSGNLIHFMTRPGVFSHRKLDLGARRLIESMEIAKHSRVLEIGCGAGPVSLAAAKRDDSIRVQAIDSSARAVECCQWGVAKNQLEDRVAVSLNSCDAVAENEFDAVVANPPYFANMSIAELFLKTSWLALREGGRVTFVGKQPEWYEQHMRQGFDRVHVSTVGGGYCIARGYRGSQGRWWEDS